MKGTSSSDVAAAGAEVGAGIGAGIAAAALAAGLGVLAAEAGTTADDVTGRVTTPVSVAAAAAVGAGGTTRSTCPTSIRLALSRLFQRAMSFQPWPFSRPMRISVSPALTV